MLEDNFFSISQINTSNKTIEIVLHGDHPIYAGHFPSNPITPGVISLQIVQICAEHLLNTKLSLLSIRQCKFKQPISPFRTPALNVCFEDISIGEEEIQCKADICKTDGEMLMSVKCSFSISDAHMQ